ncbi:M56 family metallopeptidase [Flagellimonas iocasae]|uniref:M56 family metallopeptidase n=1 Tax=Flagellimonas iocasae TaxID=2055905 RepID=A0ABW4Y1G7_9FLAO
MEGFLLYIVKSAGISTLFLLCYLFFLRKETFFNANRVFLIAGLVLSFVIPLVSIKEIVWIEPVMLPSTSSGSPVEPGVDTPSSTLNWITLVLTVYGLGAAFLFIRLVVNLLSLKRIIAKGDNQEENGINFVETQKNITPFSFFNYLIYNPESLTKSDFATIVTHERAHIEGRHSLDILLMHTVLLLQWFNPFIWLYKDSVEHNLEFIADRGALQLGRDRVGYQNLMLRTMVGAAHPYFSNSFYNSIIKKRIVMLNKQRSQKSNVWKFGIVLPLLIGFVVSFQTTTVAQIKKVENQSENGLFEHVYSINKNSTDDEIAEIKSSIEQNGGTFTHSLKRNAKGEITELELQIKNKGTGRFTSTFPFSECYFGTTKDGIFVADNTEVFNGLKTRMLLRKATSTKVNDNSNGVTLRSSSGNKPLIIIDGKEKPKADMDNLGLEPEEIESMNVLKDEMAVEKYGAKGSKGVVEITTKKFKGSKTELTVTGYGQHLVKADDKSNGVSIRTSSDVKPLIVIDGKEQLKADMDNLDMAPEKIESITVLKDKTATEKYGEKGKNGVIEITTKKED